jgi:hypothetical protein
VIFGGIGERLEFTHRAHSRETFARGALCAAQWLANKPRLYSILCRMCCDYDVEDSELNQACNGRVNEIVKNRVAITGLRRWSTLNKFRECPILR